MSDHKMQFDQRIRDRLYAKKWAEDTVAMTISDIDLRKWCLERAIPLRGESICGDAQMFYDWVMQIKQDSAA